MDSPQRGRGRPVLLYWVELIPEGERSTVWADSMRGRVLAHLRANGGRAHIRHLEAALGPKTKAVVQKLRKAGWVSRQA